MMIQLFARTSEIHGDRYWCKVAQSFVVPIMIIAKQIPNVQHPTFHWSSEAEILRVTCGIYKKTAQLNRIWHSQKLSVQQIKMLPFSGLIHTTMELTSLNSSFVD